MTSDVGLWAESKHPRDSKGRFASTGEEPKPSEPIRVREASPKDFASAFGAAFKDSPFTNHVTHYTDEELKGMKLFTSEDGKAGVAVHDHGDGRVEATALFNAGSSEKGAGIRLLAHVIKNAGVNYVECYGPKLNKLYAGAGFKPSSSSRFNKEYAAKTWNFKKFDSPNYHTMTR